MAVINTTKARGASLRPMSTAKVNKAAVQPRSKRRVKKSTSATKRPDSFNRRKPPSKKQKTTLATEQFSLVPFAHPSSGILSLPRELRDMIYRYLDTDQRRSKDSGNRIRHDRVLSSGLLNLNHQIRAEYVESCMANGIAYVYTWDHKYTKQVNSRIPALFIPHIQRLVLETNIYTLENGAKPGQYTYFRHEWKVLLADVATYLSRHPRLCRATIHLVVFSGSEQWNEALLDSEFAKCSLKLLPAVKQVHVIVKCSNFWMGYECTFTRDEESGMFDRTAHHQLGSFKFLSFQ